MPVKKIHRESVDGVEAVLDRMWQAVGRPLVGYAQAFDVSDSSIKNWRHRGRVSREYLEGFALEHGVSLDWLLHGDQQDSHQPGAHQVNQNAAPYGLKPDETALLAGYRQSSPEVRAAALRMLADGRQAGAKLPARIKVQDGNLPAKQFMPPRPKCDPPKKKKDDAA